MFVSALKSERTALITLTSDNKGEKSHLFATSQKALVVDATEVRNRSSVAAFQRIAAQGVGYLITRLETL